MNLRITDHITPAASFHVGAASRSNVNKQQYRENSKRPNNKNKTVKPCVYCQEPYFPADFTKVVTSENSYAIIKQKKLCYNCFGNHKVSDCYSNYNCRKCNRKHQTCLYENKKQQTENQTSNPGRCFTAVNIVNGEEDSKTTSLSTSNEKRCIFKDSCVVSFGR